MNAVWDLYAKRAGKPLWRLLADMSPAEIVGLVDWRYIDDALSPDDARAMLERLESTKGAPDRGAAARRLPGVHDVGRLTGYDDAKIRRLCREALADGWTMFKLKVGAASNNRSPADAELVPRNGRTDELTVELFDQRLGQRRNGMTQAGQAVQPVLEPERPAAEQ